MEMSEVMMKQLEIGKLGLEVLDLQKSLMDASDDTDATNKVIKLLSKNSDLITKQNELLVILSISYFKTEMKNYFGESVDSSLIDKMVGDIKNTNDDLIDNSDIIRNIENKFNNN